MGKTIVGVVAVLVAALVAVGGAGATKPGSGSTTGVGSVFVPNPVQSLGDESLTDQKDSDAAVPAAAYHDAQLTNLDGSGFLHGDFASIISETGNAAYSTSNTFRYTRHQDEFEQVMAYYWITESEKYIQTLGFGSRFRGVNNRPQNVRINQWGADNSFATDHPKNELRFGKGGVDDAEDAEVILHEYGHAIHFSQNFSFASEEAGAISEGFGDYWAAEMSSIVTGRFALPNPDPACLADWDATSYTSSVPHCLRRVDEDLHYPADLSGEVHHDGQIWSRALWDIRNSLPDDEADTIILLGQFDFPGTTMTALANSTVAVAQLFYGASDAATVTAAFHARGII
jgi:hypothetical protein